MGGLNGHNIYDYITSRENIFVAWREFQKGKIKKPDVLDFANNFEENLLTLRNDLLFGKYNHGSYKSFFVCDPKLRHIHKASVRDRILHHAIFRILYPIFDKIFIFDSYSSRKNKGTHRAVKRFKNFAWKLSRNNTKTVWILKCDIKKFFDSVDQRILIDIIKNKIGDEKAVKLIENIIYSFEVESEKGIPLGNLTSQLFSNVYLNELDQFIKRKLRVKCYVRYADDFVILSGDEEYLKDLIFKINGFLQKNLKLRLHPKKISINKWHQGVDFLGYVVFPYFTILRTKTKKRMFKKIKNKYREFKKSEITEKSFNQSLRSYLGILKHCRGNKILKNISRYKLM